MTGTQSEVMSFGRWWKQYDSGSLVSGQNFSRKRDSMFIEVEKDIMKYLELRNRLHKKDGIGLNWEMMLLKAEIYAATSMHRMALLSTRTGSHPLVGWIRS